MRTFILATALLTGFGVASFVAPASATPVGPSQLLTASSGISEQVKMKRSRPAGLRKIPSTKGL
ncbi:hypothetical protein [Methylobacterium symbioticum]|uniref:Uncharacterized protein n=1 Tax=Methylobacterium symbioticum TaxID=2584084 RepID=A0A509EKN2_9HYPH|nr:hypothetical protein [Methylobacterium symbioticum]VUD74592.1 hypothetical protein MET9862_05224 [Methylobacterium symbioticum]